MSRYFVQIEQLSILFEQIKCSFYNIALTKTARRKAALFRTAGALPGESLALATLIK